MFEPYYDSYAACTAMAGAQRRVVQLQAPLWSFDRDTLESAITDRTRLILVNTPHNPTQVFSRAELEIIADACRRHNLIAVTDEVYEHLVYESPTSRSHHLRAWLNEQSRYRQPQRPSPLRLEGPVGVRTTRAHQSDSHGKAVSHLRQRGSVSIRNCRGLTQSDDYLVEAAQTLRQKRDLLAAGLDGVGLHVFASPGTFFLTTDIAPLSDKDFYTFCLELAERCVLWRSRVRSSTTTRSRAGTWCVGCFQSVSKCSRKRSNAWSDFDDS